jgi:uncharacterized membrane protein YecN with MAPEG domain
MLPITALYAGILALLYVALSVNVIRTRRAAGVSLGHAGDKTLERRIRAHGNFAEYAPMGLILVGLTEGLGADVVTVHGLGAALLVGRLCHAFALTSRTPRMRARVAGMALTFAVLISGALLAMALALG